MNIEKLLKNAEIAGADLSVFHAPDRKWKNYYIEDEENNLLFLVPSYLFYGVIVLDLDIARKATFTTSDGAIHRLSDYTWGLSSISRKSCYPKVAVIDRKIKCGRTTVLLNSVILNNVKQEDGITDRHSFDNINGNKLDNRLCNLRFGVTKNNNDTRYRQNIPEIKYCFKTWWK